ncbi:succinate dehydrogenase/fumarate reductase iron-sulfur subunit [Infirmifilum uzonense]|uniref:succinate dehydrogenase/fumarate reductase iron-sulfur subunit n=1 Tax=Infirmifilum uzonense TaxID=1550241 RepID=UPI003C7144E9
MRYKVVIRRYKDGRISFDTFEVEANPSESVLDVVERISIEKDKTLVFEHACHHGVCGACGMVINGVERLACITRIGDVARNGVVVLEPLRGFKVISDLAVDKSRMFGRYRLVAPSTLEKLELRLNNAVSIPREKLYDCLECGICYSACPIANTFPEYLGPSLLALISRSGNERVPRVVDSRRGVWGCHAAFECSVRCPVNFKPGESILKLRRNIISGRVRVEG